MKPIRSITLITTCTAVAGLALAAGLSVSAQPVVLDDFEGDPKWDRTILPDGAQGFIGITDGELTIEADHLPLPYPAAYALYDRDLPIKDGYTLEVRVDRLYTTDTAHLAAAIWVIVQSEGTPSQAYGLFCGRERIMLDKIGEHGESKLFAESFSPTVEPVVLKLRITRVPEGLELGMQVLSKEDPTTVIFEDSVTDTQGVDPVATIDDFWQPDPGPPFDEPVVRFGLAHVQWIRIREPTVALIFDNFEYEYIPLVPPLAVEKAVRLTWPADAETYQVVGAATVEGPWEEVNEPIVEMDGTNYMSVPAPLSEVMKVFRLRKVEAP